MWVYLEQLRCRVWRRTAKGVEVLVDPADLGGKPKVSHLDHIGGGEKDVFGFEVSVDEVVVMLEREREKAQ